MFINFRLWTSLKSATDCCQRERQIQQDARGSAHIARVSQQCLYENCPQVIELEQWSPNNSSNLNAMKIPCLRSDRRSYILKRSPEAKNSFWIKSRSGEDMRHVIVLQSF